MRLYKESGLLVADYLIVMGIGGLFILLGLATMLWGKVEEKGYYNSLSTRPDVREYLEHWPERPEPGALKIGGWIAIAIGLAMLALGMVLWANYTFSVDTGWLQLGGEL
ncbi:hypothetical protein M1N57_00485 [Dehalococcoidales bacterium]|nr:hypothetical protein [Dehalococcoidales bacterium]